jgi:hypothetical protein
MRGRSLQSRPGGRLQLFHPVALQAESSLEAKFQRLLRSLRQVDSETGHTTGNQQTGSSRQSSNPDCLSGMDNLPPRNATPLPSRSFLEWQSSSMVAGVVCYPLIACLDGGKSFIRKRKSARCGKSPTAPILAENFSPAMVSGGDPRNKIGGCTSLMKHGTVNLFEP